MNKKRESKISKFLSYILRHNPSDINIVLDGNGYADVLELIDKSKHKLTFTKDELIYVVNNNSKRRFGFNIDNTKIRASQGHSINVNLGYTPIKPPTLLYHGTYELVVDSIKLNGLKRMGRDYVHLTDNIETALNVGGRHGKPVLLTIKSLDMYNDGYKFYCSDNGVWLTDDVPIEYITKK